MSLLLLAQLVAPPLQQGPVRLPESRPGQERPAPAPGRESPPGLEIEPGSTPQPPAGGAPARPAPPVPLSALPAVEGLTLYSRERQRTILGRCSAIADPAERLDACAAALSAQLVADGYVNSRVYVEPRLAPGRLVVVEGRLVELRVSGNDDWLNRRIGRLLRSRQGRVLHLPSLERDLQLLRRIPWVKQLRGNLSRLGSDPSQATLTIAVEAGAPRWQGDLSLRNDGNSGSGEARFVASLLKPGALTAGDTLLVYGEFNGKTDPELGLGLGSLTYSLPLTDSLLFTTAFGLSRRNLIELPGPEFANEQFQALGQLEWVFAETPTQRWSAFLGLNGTTSTNLVDGQSLPGFLPQILRNPQSGYMRLGVNGSGQGLGFGWGGSAYVLAGTPDLMPGNQVQEWRQAGLDPGSATAIGGLMSASWAFAPSWQLNGRLAGQWAFNPLLPPMQFSLGSDVGLRGLPGQLISGDSGWLAVSEASWTFWQNKSHALQLVPFVGAGGVRTNLPGVDFSDTVGSAGLLLRWLAGENWALELGYAKSFETGDNPGAWLDDWVLGSGLYAKVQFRF